jgi:hypothetical protein
MALHHAVEAAIGELELSGSDKGAVELALTYAREIDTGVDQLEALGPKLLTTLEALGATPRARAALLKGGQRDSSTGSPLDQLRDRRARRAAAMDTAAEAPIP